MEPYIPDCVGLFGPPTQIQSFVDELNCHMSLKYPDTSPPATVVSCTEARIGPAGRGFPAPSIVGGTWCSENPKCDRTVNVIVATCPGPLASSC